MRLGVSGFEKSWTLVHLYDEETGYITHR